VKGDERIDEAAAFCRAEYPRLVGTLVLLLGDADVAQELAQEALLRACARWDRVRGLDSPGGWTWRVAHNLAVSHLRRRSRSTHLIGASPQTTHHDPDVAAVLSVRAAVAALPLRQRTALVLRHYLDLPVDEVAGRMEVSPDAVRSLTKRAIAALRDHLQTRVPPEGDRDA
jgi:RNA polymerase sigma-70 factor (ECF subfamily)